MLRRSRFCCRFTVFSAFLSALALVLYCGCGKSNPAAPETKYGAIEIRASIVNRPLAKTAAGDAVAGVNATVATLLVIEVSGDGLAEPVRIERDADFSRPNVINTVTGVPVGKNRRITIWAAASNGTVTHIDSIVSHTVNVETAKPVSIFTTLIPAAGSIYLQFVGLQTNYSAIHANFTSLNGRFVVENTAMREARMFMTLDNIPHNTAGILTVSVIDNKGDTAHVAAQALTFNARSDNIIDLQFVANNSAINFNLAIQTPGVTIGVHDFANPAEAIEETGELVITEIMWNAGTSNYFEVYNTLDVELFFNELAIEFIGTSGRNTIRLPNVTIAPRSYLVFGRSAMQHVDIVTASSYFTSTGAWITLRRSDGTIIDRVAYPGSSNSIEWPVVSGTRRYSVELARDKYCAQANNFGKNWRVTTAGIIEGTTADYGTPGR